LSGGNDHKSRVEELSLESYGSAMAGPRVRLPDQNRKSKIALQPTAANAGFSQAGGPPPGVNVPGYADLTGKVTFTVVPSELESISTRPL
jgi:hypothetical protein